MKNLIFGGYLDKGEYILEVAHRHPLILKINSFKTFMVGILPPVILYFFFPQLIILWLPWFAVGFLGMLYHFFDWYYDAWLITNMGVIDVERNGLFEVSSTRVEHYQIESISYTIKGVLQTMFRYGDITLDKMGANTHIELKDAARPMRLEKKILHYQEIYVRKRSVKNHEALKEMLSEMIAHHVNNNQGKGN